MAQLSVGEDLFATISVVGLTVLFSVALAHSYHNYAERRNTYEDLSTALDIAGQLKNDILVEHGKFTSPGFIGFAAPAELGNYCKMLTAQGIGVFIEVRDLDGNLVWSYGSEPNAFSGYFSPPCSVNLPIAIARGQGSAQLGELIVRVWRS